MGLRFFISFLLICLTSYALAEGFVDSNVESKNQAIKQALAKSLHTHPQWLTLLHVVNGKSQIDDKRFFNSPQGQVDSKAELIATIEAFYHTLPSLPPPQDLSLDEISTHPYDTHARCRFQARFEFLNENLQFENLPDITCYEYQQMRDYINPQSISIVFPSAHINSPASMFGHTFLLFESAYNSRLLSYAINYAAAVNQHTENPFVFTFKGLFGFYEGYYSIAPYYDTLKEYRDTEHRDIWEFRLNFNKAETLRAFNHMWELRNIYSYYYFFDENCSYNLFWILEAARPSVSLREYFIYQVIPPESLFVMQEEGLISQESYRSSKRRIIKAYEKQFDYQTLKQIKKTALGEPLSLSSLPSSKQQRQYFLEAALELSEYYYIDTTLDKDSYTSIAHKIAHERSKLGRGEAIVITPSQSPLKGHRAVRLFTGVGVEKQRTKALLEARASYHDFSESDRGFLEGTEIEFVRLLLSYDAMQSISQRVRIEELQLFALSSLAPISPLFQPISYRISLGADRIFMSNLDPYLRFGAGGSFGLDTWGIGYYLLEGLGAYSTQAYKNQKAIAGLGNTLGILVGGQEAYKINIEYSNFIYSQGVVENRLKSTLSFHLSQYYALFVKYQWKSFNAFWQHHYNQAQAGVRLYF